MKKKHTKAFLVALLAISTASAFAQNVAINNSGSSAYVSAILDLSNNNTAGTVGLLPPYVTLTALGTFGMSGTAAQSNGLIVYNTGGALPAGLYYWNNTTPAWVSMGGGGALAGGTTNYLARWTSATTLGIGVTEDNNATVSMSNPSSAPVAVQMLTVIGNATAINAIVGGSTATGGAGVTGTLINGGASGGYGVEGTVSGAGGGFQYAVYGASSVTAGNGIGVWGQATGGGAAINYGGYFNATGGATNYGIIVPAGGGFVGLGTITPARQLEIGGNANTIRINGLKLGSTWYSATTPATANSSMVMVNNSTGDLQSLAPSATNGQVLTHTAAGPAWGGGAAGLKNIQAFTANGNYTPTAGTTNIKIKVIGGGGGGGGANSAGGNTAGAGGGGAGGECDAFVAGIGAGPYVVTIGAAGAAGTNAPGNGGNGGTSKIVIGATTYQATGGAGGIAGGNASNDYAGGGGGLGSAGYLNITGQSGGQGSTANYAFNLNGSELSCTVSCVTRGSALLWGFGGAGGSTSVGGGGQSNFNGSISNISGFAATGYGAGGSGASCFVTGTGTTGGAGAPGVIIIEEY